jgi:putative endonuclease
MFWVYMLRCADRSFYLGHTDNLERRVNDHIRGIYSSCYAFSRRPVELVYSQEFASRAESLLMERQIKGWNRAKKIALIAGDWMEISRLSNFKYGDKNPSTSSSRTE